MKFYGRMTIVMPTVNELDLLLQRQTAVKKTTMAKLTTIDASDDKCPDCVNAGGEVVRSDVGGITDEKRQRLAGLDQRTHVVDDDRSAFHATSTVVGQVNAVLVEAAVSRYTLLQGRVVLDFVSIHLRQQSTYSSSVLAI